MNTSILSSYAPLPSADDPPQTPVSRGARPADDAVRGSEVIDADKPEDVSGDSDKADAFAAMLAALMSAAAAPTEPATSPVETTAVESAAATATDVPRDGAGAPLFTSTFLTASAPAATSTTSVTATPVQPAATDSSALASASGADLVDGGAAGNAAPELAGLEATDGEASVPSELTALATPAATETSAIGRGDAAQGAAAAEETDLHVVDLEFVDGHEAPPEAAFPDTASGETVVQTGMRTADAATSSPVVPAESNAASDSGSEIRKPDAVTTASARVKQENVTPHAKAAVPADASNQKSGLAENQNLGVAEPFENPTEATDARAATAESREATASTLRPGASTRPLESPAAVTTGESAVANTETVIAPVTATTEATVGRDVVSRRPNSRTDIEPAAVKSNADVVEADGILASSTASPSGGIANAASSAMPNDITAASNPAHVSQQVMQALAAYEAELPAGGSRSFQMLLDPPELGRLLVQMSRTSKGVDVRIAAENESVRSILEAGGQELQQGLQLSGFDLGQFNGSSSSGTFANGEEIVFAPSLQSIAASSGTAATSRTVTSVHTTRGVNVFV